MDGSRINISGNVQQPLVSIIIATYNAAEDLSACLKSIKDLSVKDIEIVIVDGGSNDNTLDILRDLNLQQVKWVSEPDNGIYDALNKGVDLSDGRWLHFLGADDRLLPGFKKLLGALSDEHTVYYGNSLPADKLLQGAFSKYRLAKYCMNHQSILYPARVFDRYRYNLRYQVFADYALNMQVWGDPLFKTRHLDIPVVMYNLNGFSSAAIDRAFLIDRNRLVRKHLGFVVYIRYLLKKYKARKTPGGIDPGFIPPDEKEKKS